MSVGAVVIGRNEGDRLLACLDALKGQVAEIIYVDSGSTDGSWEAARARGVRVVALDMAQPFTAARARNAGLGALGPGIELVQFLDGDCVIQPEWIGAAQDFLAGHPEVAVVCGRRREEQPGASTYNRLVDREWDTPIGAALACGGDAMMRRAPLEATGGYRESLIAGEEPELCLRLRRAGWKVWRLDREMTRHDARITRFGQWWRRSIRAGHAFAEGAWLHGRGPERHWVAETRRAVIWGLALPVSIVLLGAVLSPWALLGLLAYPAQLLRLAAKGGWSWAVFTVLGKFAEAWGVLRFWLGRLRSRPAGIIEYR
ncbi:MULTISPECIES: glycosyltransferase [unclassified Sulfitobacter]|uniref:glycosyltransferase n=1 Tax=unclassified Sulfitobacter TaxID=196795 RepID=UPI0007C244B4|nr:MULTISPECIES: glycosyltransferase [unclassified Sulfitobacter]KZY06253.1 glycosyl transferase [Sulfitobacter sp. HI0023]KZY27081.1 glycosyl transferase [Sulfitobacter sp. HI0040]KZZ67342.1 glycosyl transferase [Sulfitobacter sp. HI0129]